ncbi:MAG: CinA family protein [Treponema sp.]|nr:CinA family protein [Treponema sp.]
MIGAEPSEFLKNSEARATMTALSLVELLTQSGRTLVLAESCTAGLVSDLIARISGASAVLWGSFVSYSQKAKELMLDLDGGLIERCGLVSREVVSEMAIHALRKSGASFSAAVTGLAGPLGDGSATPVGTVWIALAFLGSAGEAELAMERKMCFRGSRAEVRMQAAVTVLEELLNLAVRTVDKKLRTA